MPRLRAGQNPWIMIVRMVDPETGAREQHIVHAYRHEHVAHAAARDTTWRFGTLIGYRPVSLSWLVVDARTGSEYPVPD